MRIKFEHGEQRKFLDLVLEKTGSPSLVELINRGIDINHSTLKNYYSERRLMSQEMFNLLCKIAELDREMFEFEEFLDNWGQSKGGKISKRSYGPTRN